MRPGRKRFAGGLNGFVFNATISTVVDQYNVRQEAVNAGWDQVLPLFATVTITSTGVCYSTTTSQPGIRFAGTFPALSQLSLNIQSGGVIDGARGLGGAGGVGTAVSAPNGQPGGIGGAALSTNFALRVDNLGSIRGGGGGGGGGGAQFTDNVGWPTAFASGGAGGNGRTHNNVNTAGSAGGFSNPIGGHSATGGTGGFGGGYGQPGDTGFNGSATGGTGGGNGVGGNGGAAGAAVVGNSLITWLNTGTRLGPIT